MKNEDISFSATYEVQDFSANKVLLAVGQHPAARIVSSTAGIEIDPRGFVITRERSFGMTTRAGIFACDNVVHGPTTVVLAMREAKKVASGIVSYVDAVKLVSEL